MTVSLTLRTDAGGRLLSSLDGQVLSATPFDALPSLKMLQADPLHIGKTLTAALGGTALLARLDADPERLLLLDCDARADAIAWEFAALDSHEFLAVQFGLLRLIDKTALQMGDHVGSPQQVGDHVGSPLQFVFLGADPLVDEKGDARDGFRLGIENELRGIQRTLKASGVALQAQRVPPTQLALQRALRRGPAILHLTCHGDIVQTDDGAMAVLHLENENGKAAPLRGNFLATMPPRGVLRLVLLSACHTAEGRDSDLARLLVTSGVPFAIGMQAAFLDRLSEPFAVALYDTLLAGQSLSEALRQARQAIVNDIAQVGLPVGYTTRDAWGALPLTPGQSLVGNLGLPGNVQLVSEVQPPRPLLGRNGELHALAQTYSQGHKVVTITGTGGIGKTALAASFAERFAWRWADGVRTISFASDVVDAQAFRLALLRELEGAPIAQNFADADADAQVREILRFLRDWQGLLLIDNYESVLQRLEPELAADFESAAVHRLVAQMADGGATLLLTSRQNPAGLRGEIVFPRPSEPLSGLAFDSAIALFFQHSAKAKAHLKARLPLAMEIAQKTEGHPLAIALLAGEYDTSDVADADFLQNWENELASARRVGLSEHHVKFATAFERSYNRLTGDDQKRLRALSVLAFPFYAQGAIVWTGDERPTTEDGAVDEEKWLARVREKLGVFTRRNLLEIDGWFEEGVLPSAYRFQPALRQELARRLSADERAALTPSYAAYADWFVDMAWNEIRRDPAIARRAQQAANELIALADAQPADRLAHYCWQLGEILQQFGRISDAEKVLARGAASAEARGDDVRRERILFQQARLAVLRGDLDRALKQYEQAAELARAEKNEGEYSVVIGAMADIYITRGDLDGAMKLYQQSLQIKEQLGDLKGKGATLHAMANVFVTRGDLDGAMQLYQQSLQIKEQLGDLKGKAATLHNMAVIATTRGDLDGAMQLYQQSLQIHEQLGDLQGKAATLTQMANVHMSRGDWNAAEVCLHDALDLSRRLQDPQGVAFATVKLGLVAQARGDRETALARYREGLAIFERLGMPRETAQVREMIAELESKPVGSPRPDRFESLIAQARAAAERGDVANAITAQEQAVALMRQQGESKDALVALSVMLYNLGGYYARAERFGDAVRVMQEVVALDERTGHQDLESDRKVLQQFQRLSALSPEELARLKAQQAQEESAESPDADIQAQLAALPPEQRAQVEAAMRAFARMSPEEQAAVIAQAQRAQIQMLADQVRDAAIAVQRGQATRDQVLPQLEQLVAQIEREQPPDSPWGELAAFVRAVIVLLNRRAPLILVPGQRAEPLPPVPAAYAGHLAAIQNKG